MKCIYMNECMHEWLRIAGQGQNRARPRVLSLWTFSLLRFGCIHFYAKCLPWKFEEEYKKDLLVPQFVPDMQEESDRGPAVAT